jgi:hypothetical protein
MMLVFPAPVSPTMARVSHPEQGEYLLPGRGRVLHDVELLREVLNGVEEPFDVGDEHDQQSEGDPVVRDSPCAEVDDRCDGEPPHESDEGAEDGDDVEMPHMGLVERVVEPPEGEEARRLPDENFDDADTRDDLVEKAVQLAHPGSDGTVGLSDLDPEEHGDDDQEGDADHEQHGHTVAGEEHDDGDAEHHEQILKQRHHDRGEQLVQLLHVVGHAVDQLSHGISVEK